MQDGQKSAARRPDPQSRKCLMCGETFASEGPHNRICSRCKLTRTWREGDVECAAHDWKRQP